MIWHIFKKDLRLHWRFAAAVAVLGWLTLIVAYRADHGGDASEQQIWNLTNLLLMMQMLASGILAATVVQTDGIPGVRQDWLIRPISRVDLLLAKLLFVLVLIDGPIFAGSVVEALAYGIPAGQAFIGALMGSLCVLGVFYLPVMAFASVTRNFAENIVTIVTALVFASLVQGIGINLTDSKLFQMTGVQWLGGFAMIGTALLGAVIIVALQYLKRRTVAARWLTAGFGLLCVASTFIPWQPAFAVQQRLSPHPGGAAGVNLEFQPALGRYREPSRTYANGYSYIRNEKGTTVYLPIHISGLGADTVLRIDMVQARLTGPNSKPQDLTPVVPPPVLHEGPVQESSPARTTTHDLIFLPAVMYEKLRDTPVRLELDYSLTLLRLNSARGIPALEASENVPEFGHCETRLDKAGTELQLRCMMPARTPPCATVFLENVPSGRRNPEIVLCRGQYTPFNLQFGPDTLRRAIVDLPFRDTSGLLHLPVDGSQLPQSQVVMRFYHTVEHFRRSVVIPEVRLSEWLPM